MAGMNASPVPEVPGAAVPSARAQLGAIATLRWQIFRNSLQTLRGRLELVSRVFVGLMLTVGWIAVGVGLGTAAYFFVSRGRTEWLAILLWGVFLFWQLFPIMATAFTVPFDSTNLLRFPMRFSSFFQLSLVYGLLDPASIAGCFWVASIAGGIALADPGLFLLALPVLLLFAAVNLLLGRTVFAWLERLLAQRRTREILGVVFIFLVLSFQLIGPLADRWGRHTGPMAGRLALLLPIERALPPGLAGQALFQGSLGNARGVAAAAASLSAYGVLFAWLLGMRLRAQFRGENLGESLAPVATPSTQAVRLGWRLQGLPGPIAAVFEKELRYLSRSGPMLFNFVTPLFVLVVFRLSPAPSGDPRGFFAHMPDLTFPAAASFALLVLTNLVYNTFGVEASGIQFYFMAPVGFREILLAKNLAHTAVLAAVTGLVWLGACLLYRPPALGIVLATFAGLLFALPVNLAAGNLLSLYFPKKFDFDTFGRQRASAISVFASLGIQIVVIGFAGLTLFTAYFFRRLWIADGIFLLLAVAAGVAYFHVLRRCGSLASERREVLTAELCRA